VIMKHSIEHNDYEEADRIATLESRAAELERRLLAVTQANGLTGWINAALPGDPAPPPAGTAFPTGAYPIYFPPGSGFQPGFGSAAEGAHADGGIGDGSPDGEGAVDDRPVDDAFVDAGAAGGGRTEALINRGRPAAKRSLGQGLLRHWRLFVVAAISLAAGVVAVLVMVGGPSPSWPASVAAVQTQIKTACANPDTGAEPSGLNFACAKDSQQVLWVFSLLTSGDNPGYVDASTGRKGLEPITPSQGGDIAWSLNLRHLYNPASPIDSLTVAARAVNNIVYGATMTTASGAADVEPGLESTAANCRRYTGSAALATRAGYPARCAAPLTTAGTAALVSDAFQQWMGGTPSRIASEAGTLYANADNPGNPQVQAILASLPASGG